MTRRILILFTTAAFVLSAWAGWSRLSGRLATQDFLPVFDLCVYAWLVLVSFWALPRPPKHKVDKTV